MGEFSTSLNVVKDAVKVLVDLAPDPEKIDDLKRTNNELKEDIAIQEKKFDDATSRPLPKDYQEDKEEAHKLFQMIQPQPDSLPNFPTPPSTTPITLVKNSSPVTSKSTCTSNRSLLPG